ncbi:MAG TPA: hypothetical protein VF103_05300 [Polyangiaceae bacterium]
MAEDDRYTRQRRLREIGDAGQERLFRAHAVVAGREAALLELLYLHRAGVGAVELDSLATPPAFVHEALFRHAASRRVAAASWRALKTLVEVVGTGATS